MGDRIDARLKEFTTATINLVLCDQNGIGNKAEITKKYEGARTQLSEEIQRLRAEVERLRHRCAEWAASYGEKCSDLEDLNRQNAELADARIADGFVRYDAVEAARAEAMERAAQIADGHHRLVAPHHPDKPGDDPIAQGYGNAALNIAAAIRAEASKKGGEG